MQPPLIFQPMRLRSSCLIRMTADSRGMRSTRGVCYSLSAGGHDYGYVQPKVWESGLDDGSAVPKLRHCYFLGGGGKHWVDCEH